MSNDQRREELRNAIADLRQRLNAAGTEMACAIARGWVVADIPAESRDGIVDLRRNLYIAECEMAAMDGLQAPPVPLCMVAPPEPPPTTP